nr:reverse transcriptase domain-containing protein [Tanacetum cinerariifolium]
MPTWCHMFNSTLTENVRVWFDDLSPESIDNYDDLKKAFLENYLQQKKYIKDPIELYNIKQRDGESTKDFVRRYRLESRDVNGAPECMRISGFVHGITNHELIKRLHDKNKGEGIKGPMIIEAKIGGHCIHRMYVDGGSASEILYEHCFNRHRPKIKNQLVPAITSLIGFSGEIIWPIGQIQRLVKIGDEEHSASTRMNFVVVRPPSPYNGIIGRPRVRKLLAVPSTAHEMLKLPVEGGNYPKKQQVGSTGMRVGPDQKRPPGSQTNSGRKSQGGKKPRILRANNNDRFYSHRRGPQEAVALRGPELNYTSMEKLILALVHTSKRLKRYFQAHPIIVITDQPIQQVLSRPKLAGRLQKWSIELGEYATHYRPRVSVKWQILVDFIVERPEEDFSDALMEVEEELPEPWILFTNGSSCTDGSGVGLILTNPEGVEFIYAPRFRFEATNNEAKYEALIVGLRIAKQMGVKNLQANVDSRLIANQMNETYVAKEVDMIRYLGKVRTLTNSFKAFSIRHVPRSENKKADALSKIASTSFAHLSKQVLVEELKENSISEVEILAVVKEEGDIWMTPIFKYFEEGTLLADVKKAKAIRRPLQANYVLREIHEGSCSMHAEGPGKVRILIVAIDYFTKFELPGEIISDNGKQFRDDPFKDWCEKLCIREHFAYVKHPQTNDLVERANRNLREGIKARLDARSKNWIEELPHVLWAHRTMIKSSNGDTPFSLTYKTEAVIPAEIGMPTLRTAEVDLAQNNEALEINLDLLEERREEAAIREKKYYNSKVQNTSFKPGGLVYRNNDASRAEDTGKLGPKWEGP